jgi:hypothetical protein
MLTILSTCFGLIPFIMEGQNEIFWFSLAIGTIGGLVFSLLGVFWALPVFLWKKEPVLQLETAEVPVKPKVKKKRRLFFWRKKKSQKGEDQG